MSEKIYGSSLSLDERVKLFNEWLEDGGIKTIWSEDLLDDLIKVKAGADGKVIRETVTPLVNAAMLAYEGSQLTTLKVADELKKSRGYHYFNKIAIQSEEK